MVEDEAVRAELLGHSAAVAVIVLVALLVVSVVAIVGGALEAHLSGCHACRGKKVSREEEEQVVLEGWW